MKKTTAAFVVLSCLLNACSTANNAMRTYAAQQQTDAAMERQQVASQTPTPDNKRVYLDLIRNLQERGLYLASLAHIDAYEKANGASPQTKRLRADALRETQQSVAAEPIYRSLIDTAEASAAWRGLGLIAGENGDYANSSANLHEAVKLEPANAVTLGDLGYAQLRSGDLAAARLSLAQAAELSQDNKKILSNLALLLLLSGERDKANAVMTQAKLPEAGRRAVYQMADEIAINRNVKVGCTAGARSDCPPPLRYATAEDFAASLQRTSAKLAEAP